MGIFRKTYYYYTYYSACELQMTSPLEITALQILFFRNFPSIFPNLPHSIHLDTKRTELFPSNPGYKSIFEAKGLT